MDDSAAAAPGPRMWVPIARGVAITLGLTVLYFLLPAATFPGGPTLVLVVGAVAFAAVMISQLRAISRTHRPMTQGFETVVLLLAITVVTFAMTHLAHSIQDPSAFNEPLTKVDSLYFTVTVVTTTGFGDIVPVAEYSRLAVTANMLTSVVLVAVVVRIVARAISHAANERARG